MQRVTLERKVLSENDRIAEGLRERFQRSGLFCANLISSPGSGKTALLERTLGTLAPGVRAAVLTGDIQTDNDARRLARFGYPVRQITTGGACHLDARMVERALADWKLDDFDLLFIENVGNLVCPTGYDLGEDARAVLLSVTEGEDKPLKYPATFHRADVLVFTKIDLLPYTPFHMVQARENALAVNPRLQMIETSAITDAGLDVWRDWLRSRARIMC